jgi:AraC-like DNA-binding protein
MILKRRARTQTGRDLIDPALFDRLFGTTDTLVRAFRRVLNTTPTDYRNRFRILTES